MTAFLDINEIGNKLMHIEKALPFLLGPLRVGFPGEIDFFISSPKSSKCDCSREFYVVRLPIPAQLLVVVFIAEALSLSSKQTMSKQFYTTYIQYRSSYDLNI